MPDPYEPLHARPPVLVEAPRLISIIAILTGGESERSEQKASREEVEAFIRGCYEHFNHPLPHPLPLQTLYDCFLAQQIIEDLSGNALCVMQKHTSFFSVSFYRPDTNIPGRVAWSAVPEDLLHGISEKVAFRTHIRVERADSNRTNYGQDLVEVFNCGADPGHGFVVSEAFTDLFASRVSDGGAVAWTPFKRFSDGFNRILIRDISLRPSRLGRLVRRIGEVDMYVAIGSRNFYRAQEQLKSLKNYERELKEVVKQESFVEAKRDKLAYQVLSRVSREAANLVAETRYDFLATLAFSDLVFQRIHELREERVEGWTRIGYFLERTFRPCVRTCQSALGYQRDVSQQCQEAASLLGAGLELLLEEESVQRANENRAVLGKLQSIAENSSQFLEKQKRLGFTIEIIALVPIVYYTTQLLDHAEHEGRSVLVKIIILFVVFGLVRFAGWGVDAVSRYVARLRVHLNRARPS
ncbi:MAG: DUF3422 family protein [Rhodospirillales bacterium]|nr:DUF3422 family protein [Rhodospirillales bacterium]